MSKRGLVELVTKKYVRGWDDPRLYTLAALRRRGVPPGAILAFINELGVTTAKTTTQVARFEQSVRKYLETSVPRAMLVLDPIPLAIEGFEDFALTEVEVPFSAKDPTMGTHTLHLTPTVYVDRPDFRELADEDFFRLAPGRTVGLLGFPAVHITVTGFTKGADGRVDEIRAIVDDGGSRRPKAYIHWVPDGSTTVEVRVPGRLFRSDDPAAAPGGFLEDINPDSETTYRSALIEAGFEGIRRSAPWPRGAGGIEDQEAIGPENIRFQAIRVGYFVSYSNLTPDFLCKSSCSSISADEELRPQAMDEDSTTERTVLNRIVSLKADAGRD